MGGLVLDAGALIGFDRNDRRVVLMLRRVSERGEHITIPAGALAHAIRSPERQARLARLVRQPTVTVVPLDRADATSIGRMLAATGASDVVDAHVVLCAWRAEQPVVTTDAADLLALDPRLRVVRL